MNFFFFFKGHLEATCHWTRVDCSSYDSYFPFLIWAFAQEEGGLRFPCSQHEDVSQIPSLRLPPLMRPHGGGCQWKAKQIRSRNDAPVFPHYFRSNRAITGLVCACVFTQGRPVGVVVLECSSQQEEVTALSKRANPR